MVPCKKIDPLPSPEKIEQRIQIYIFENVHTMPTTPSWQVFDIFWTNVKQKIKYNHKNQNVTGT